MSKYTPLNTFLAACPKTRLSLTFAEVENLLGAPLPRSAYDHQAWWANNPEGHSHCRAWISAGWRTENLNITARKVDFVRVSAETYAPPTPAKTRDPWGAMAGTVTIHDEEALTRPIDETWDAEASE